MEEKTLITKEENWYVATDLITGIASQGRTRTEAYKNLKEALLLLEEETDSFYSESNMAEIKRRVSEVERGIGKLKEHELTEG